MSKCKLTRLKVHAERIIVRSILNRSGASNAWGTLAGMMMQSPACKSYGFPPSVTFPCPSMTSITASKGAACSLNFCPVSKAKSVNVPACLSRMILLTMESVAYSTAPARANPPVGTDFGLPIFITT